MEGGGGDAPAPFESSNLKTLEASDVPDRKFARQLDFTGATGLSTLPDHPQSLRQVQVPLPFLSQAQIHTSNFHPQMGLIPLLMNPQAIQSVKPESPISRPRPNAEVKDGTPKKQKQCNCKHSRCLKLYCECFASGIYCDGCNCNNCHNNVENDDARREAVESTLERNPNAFRPKIANSPHRKRDVREEIGDGAVLAKHNKGCHCKKSGCLKKYCECFQANILCSENCKCLDCKNYEASEERQSLFHGDHANNIVYMQQAANAAITGAIGFSGFGSPPFTKKRKGQEHLGSASKEFQRLGQLQEVNNIKSPPSFGVSGHSKLAYRSLLADLIQPQDLTALCSVLVAKTTEAAKTFVDQTNTSDRLAKEDRRESSLASTSQDQKAPPDVNSNGIQAASELRIEDCGSHDTELQNVRPMSPGTLALMCDEQDTSFMAAVPSSMHQGVSTTSQLPDGVDMPDLYIEQERIVLTQFRDCLTRLITFGEIKETRCSGLAKNVSDSQRNGARNEAGSPQRVFGNGGNTRVQIQPSTRMSNPINKSPSLNQHLRYSLTEKNGVMMPKPEK
ncbi:unnamed protein product [Rhodiola kirilowii]